jgi:hypothetical protein
MTRPENNFLSFVLCMILFLQDHRETDHFFTVSEVLSVQSDRGFFHYRRTAFSSMIKSRVGNILARLHLYVLILTWTGHLYNTYPIEVSHSPLTLANFSSINLVFVFRCSSPTTNPVSARRVDSSFLVFSLSSHRYSYISLLFSSHFVDS